MATTETAPGKMATWLEDATGGVTDAPIGFGRMKRKEDARFIRGKGNYTRRRPPPGHGPRRDPSQPVRPRPHRVDRHVEVPRPPEGRGGRHRQGPRDPGPGLDADHLLRHAGRARGRQGSLPHAGGRLRRRTRRVLRAGRACAHRGRVRGAAGDRQRPQGARPGRAADSRRQGRSDGQPGVPDCGRPATRPPPTACSPRPTRSSRATSSTRVRTRARWRRAAWSPTSTRRPAS